MLRINPINISVHHNKAELIKKMAHILKVNTSEISSYNIVRRSIDARKKNNILYSYIVDVKVQREDRVLKNNKKNKFLSKSSKMLYKIPNEGEEELKNRPVIVGFGPAGIFAGLLLAKNGYKPLIIERGEDVDKRSITVEEFWNKGILKKESNVSFGEGGAGTFSDGKLNTMVKDKIGRNTFVLETLVEFGANPEILFDYKAHIGTDKLKDIVKNIRNEIIDLGGEVCFETKLTDIDISDDKIVSITVNDDKKIPCSVLILAIGHSARDTFELLYNKKLNMKAKSFAMGVRVQHSQNMIDVSQFGEDEADFLSPATYKLTAKSNDNRGVYSFCMCPGGYVIDASTCDGMKVVNGMSYNDRDSANANSAIIVQVDEKDLYKETNDDTALAGIKFQEKFEKIAYEVGKGKIPVQLLGDFNDNNVSSNYGKVKPCFKGDTLFCDLNEVLPEYISKSIKETFSVFDRKIKGFADKDTILAGIESRTSSPINIVRDENLLSNIFGIYPCGEGAGYAGGITSAAMDGLKVAEEIIAKYKKIG